MQVFNFLFLVFLYHRRRRVVLVAVAYLQCGKRLQRQEKQMKCPHQIKQQQHLMHVLLLLILRAICNWCYGKNRRVEQKPQHLAEDSLNKGNFLELLNWLAGNFEEVDRVVLKNALRNCQMTHHDIQQEVIKCCAQETTKLVIEELDGGHFAILADESSDVY